MNRSLLLGVGVGVVVAATAGAIAQRAIGERRNAYAEVITSNPAYVTQRVAHEVCRDQVVTRRKSAQDKRTVSSTEKRCTTVMRTEKQQVGYDIRYRFGETVSSVRLERNPGIGARLPVRDGRVVFSVQTIAKGPETT